MILAEITCNLKFTNFKSLFRIKITRKKLLKKKESICDLSYLHDIINKYVQTNIISLSLRV